MSRVSSRAPILFTLPGDCQCKGSPHEGDIVMFRPKLSVEGGIAANRVIEDAASRGVQRFTKEVETEMGWVLLFHGIADWNFLDDDGKLEPITEEVIRFGLDWETTSSHLWEKASDLYGNEAFVPFQRRLSSFSEQRQTEASTSPSGSSGKTPRKRSTPSLRTTSAASMPSPG